ncbi:hypothetical protein KM043_011383 [Ampulex compressa]|nr:hypothetical protein KM043_011383 [Ampulex compressa]
MLVYADRPSGRIGSLVITAQSPDSYYELASEHDRGKFAGNPRILTEGILTTGRIPGMRRPKAVAGGEPKRSDEHGVVLVSWVANGSKDVEEDLAALERFEGR